MFAFQVVLVLVVISGLIAYIGDNVGRSIGRKRLTAFGLRPRHTAIAITIITGALIALVSGSVLFAISSDVRTALFGLDKLRSLISERSKELDKIKSDKQSLLNEISKLQTTLDTSRKEVNNARSGRLLYKMNDIITSTVVEPSDKDITKDKLSKILVDTDSVIKRIAGSGKKHYIVMPTNELDEAVDYVSSHSKGTIVRLVAARNIVLGDDIPCHFELFENVFVFNKGDIITSAVINGGKNLPEIEQNIKDLLSQVNAIALRRGIIPDAEGAVGVIQYSRIFETAKIIKAKSKLVKISVVTTKDTNAAGPLEIDLKTID